ncbi:hypothetical protein [Methyloceanibacter sp.]|uniref:hypothetical protein n=1 Tax=Methyloceanibacter sp. TaxID=1965321 RepID=UPI003D6CB8ED
MLTRVLFALVLICGMAATALAEDAKVLALGVTDHEATTAELETGAALPAPLFNTPAIAYVLAAGLKKGDIVEIALVNEDKSLLHNTQTLGEDQGRFLLQAGKRGVPAGGWPEGTYHAKVTIARDGKTLLEQSSKPIPFE